MAQKVPPLEQSKATILAQKGQAFLKQAEADFKKKYPAIKDPNLAMWMIGKHAGLEMEEIKAASGGNEGTPITIAEISVLGKTAKQQAWTFAKSVGEGMEYEAPDNEARYSLTGCLLEVIVGETRKGDKTRIDARITDGSGVTKLVAFGDAADAFVEAHAGPGVIVNLPLCSVQYGYHPFGKERETLWWKLSVPPFGEVLRLDDDVKQYFLDMENDPVREGMAHFTTGIIIDVVEEDHEVCSECDKWVTEKNQHEKCQEKAQKARREWSADDKTFIFGTFVSINGDTRKLYLNSKPKGIKYGVDQVEVYGVVGKGGLNVSFIRKSNSPTTVVTDAVASKPKAVVKPKPAPQEEPEEQAEEEQDAEPVPVPTPRKGPKIPKFVPETDEEAAIVASAPTKAKSGGTVKLRPKAPPLEEEEEQEETEEAAGDGSEAEEEQVVVRAATKTPTAAKKPMTKAKAPPVEEETDAGQVEVIEVPQEVRDHLEKTCKQFGQKVRVFVASRQCCKLGHFQDLHEGCTKDCTDDAMLALHRALMQQYFDSLVAEGVADFSLKDHSEIKWVG